MSSEKPTSYLDAHSKAAERKPEKKYVPFIKENTESPDESPYTIEQKDWDVILEYTDPKNPDIYQMFTIKNNNWTREVSESHEWLISIWDLKWIVLDQTELSNDENINNLSKILKSYGLPLLKPEQVIEISLILSNNQ